MGRVKTVLRLIKNEPKSFFYALFYKLSKVLPETWYLRILFRLRLGYSLNLNQPKTFNEKLNWLKLFNRKPEYTIMVDKYAVKKYVEDKIGARYIVPLYGVWNSAGSIDWDSLPKKFVLKTTPNRCYNMICRDKAVLDKESAVFNMNNSLRKNLFDALGEWPYKNVRPRIIAEKLLEGKKDGEGNKPLIDYKFWCFNGKPTYMYFSIKGDGCYENFYDMDFNIVDINHGWPRHQPEFTKPASWDEMKQIASALSEGIPFIRVDFYEVDDKPYFGELTFFDWAGLRPFDSYETDLELGSLIVLPNNRIH
jgi:hypothetical protein